VLYVFQECIIDEHGLYMSSAGKYFAGKNVFEEGNSLGMIYIEGITS